MSSKHGILSKEAAMLCVHWCRMSTLEHGGATQWARVCGMSALTSSGNKDATMRFHWCSIGHYLWPNWINSKKGSNVRSYEQFIHPVFQEKGKCKQFIYSTTSKHGSFEQFIHRSQFMGCSKNSFIRSRRTMSWKQFTWILKKTRIHSISYSNQKLFRHRGMAAWDVHM